MSQPLIDWIDGEPFSRQFGDIYFSRSSGLEESRHVFLNGNDLPRRWRDLAPGSTFVIGETGFGTGLNFLAAWELWNQISPNARLHFLSFEQHPLTPAQLRRALEPWREVASLGDQLCAQYDDLSPGWHRFSFQGAAATLTLIVGDARGCLPRMIGKAHAWFLDGFAPARNPQLWEAELLNEVARHSHPGGTFATYTSAGHVRRSLQEAGFTVRKIPGHGRKREMTAGILPGAPAPAVSGDRTAIVVGAGIAGCATAHAFAQRGWRVTLIDRHGPAAGASGLPQATLHVRLPRRMLPAHQIALAGYRHSIRLWRSLSHTDSTLWRPCGTLQLDHASRRQIDTPALEQFALSPALVRRLTPEECGDVSGVAIASGGLHFPQGGWVHGVSACRALVRHPLITPAFGCSVESLQPTPDGNWIVQGDRAEFSSSLVVLANAANATTLVPQAELPVHAVRGQITLARATSASASLRAVLCGEGVITPERDGMHSIGATYRHEWADLASDPAEHMENLRMLGSLSPTLHAALGGDEIAPTGAFVSVRATIPDRTPIAGRWQHPVGPSLQLNIGHGSRGFSTAPLLAELIASEVEGEPLPLPADLVAALDPGRFARRTLRPPSSA